MAEQELLQLILTEVRSTNQKVDQLGERMDKVEQRLDKVEQRLDKVEQRLDKVEQRLDKVELRLDELETKMEVLETRQNQLEKKVDMNYHLLERFFVEQKEDNTRIYHRLSKLDALYDQTWTVVCDHTERLRKIEQRPLAAE